MGNSMSFVWCMMNALQFILYIGLISINYPANVQLLFSILFGFVNFDIFRSEDIHNALFSFSNEDSFSDTFEEFDIFKNP